MTEKKTITVEEEKRLKDAAESMKEIQEKLAPFIKPRKIGSLSTEGKWQKSSTSVGVITREEFHSALRKIARPVKKQDVEEK